MSKSEYELNLEALQDAAGEALAALRDLTKEQRGEYEGTVSRLEHVLAYAGVVLAETDPTLVSSAAHSALATAFGRVRDSLASQPSSAEDFSAEILAALSQLPVAQGRVTAQDAKHAAKTYARSSRARLNALGAATKQAKREADELSEQIEASRDEFNSLVAGKKGEANALVMEVQSSLDDLRARIETTWTEQNDSFRSMQDERSALFNQAAEGFENKLELKIQDANRRVESAVAEIERKDKDARDLLGAIGVAGTAGRWKEEAEAQREAANRWRWCTVATVAAAVVIGLLATGASNVDSPEFVGKILISAALAGLAAYAARQSSLHRHREERARTLELELAAFGPFIEPLPEDFQHDERRKMVGKTFGRLPVEAELDGGPSLAAELLRRQNEDAANASP